MADDSYTSSTDSSGISGWSPDASTVCAGEYFTQYAGMFTRTAVGTKDCGGGSAGTATGDSSAGGTGSSGSGTDSGTAGTGGATGTCQRECNCAQLTPVGQTCPDKCGGTCDGTKPLDGVCGDGKINGSEDCDFNSPFGGACGGSCSSGTAYCGNDCKCHCDTSSGSSSGSSVPNVPSGADCAAKTCVGNSCWNGSTFVSGTKTSGCATGSAKMNPEEMVYSSSSQRVYMTWSSSNATSMEAACFGLVPIDKAPIETTSAQWEKDAAATGFYVKPAGAPDGYPGGLAVGSIGKETCTFYPSNQSGPGTPFSATVIAKEAGANGDCICVTAGKACSPDSTVKGTTTCDGCKCVSGKVDGSGGSSSGGSGSGACSASCYGSNLTCQSAQPANATASSTGSCCGGQTCYKCPSGYFWNTRTCSVLGSTCDLTATLSATPSGGASLAADVTANINAAHGPIYCDNQSCGGGVVSNVDSSGCDFTCTYSAAGTYNPRVHVANSACAKDPMATVTVSGSASSDNSSSSSESSSSSSTAPVCQKDDPGCAEHTCQDVYCFDGCEYHQGTKDCVGRR